jgi:hypothetical protein
MLLVLAIREEKMAQDTADRDGMMVMVVSLKLLPEANAEDFERAMTDEIFVAAANTPGSVNRAGRSSIRSQHLLLSESSETDYLWLTKGQVSFNSMFRTAAQRMLEGARERLETFVTILGSTSYLVTGSLEVGPTNMYGGGIDAPTRGSTI